MFGVWAIPIEERVRVTDNFATRLQVSAKPVQESFWCDSVAVQWSWFARVNALCNLSRQKSREVAASLPGRFLSRRCFTLCITLQWKLNLELRSCTKKRTESVKSGLLQLQKLPGKGMEGGKKVSLRRFLADQKIASLWKKCVWGHERTSNKLLLVARHILTTGLKKMSSKLAV